MVGNTNFILKKYPSLLNFSYVDTLSSCTLGSLSPLSWALLFAHLLCWIHCLLIKLLYYLSLSWFCLFLNGFLDEGISSVTFWGLLSLEISLLSHLMYSLGRYNNILSRKSVLNTLLSFLLVLDMCGKVCFFLILGSFYENIFFSLWRNLNILFVPSDLKFCDDVFWCGFIFVHCAAPTQPENCILHFWSFFLNYFCNDI